MTLVLERVYKTFPTPAGPRDVLSEISLRVAKGEVVHLDGPSGSGKSTLLNLSGLLTPASKGKVHVDEIDCSNLNDRERTQMRARVIGLVFQSHHLLPELDCVDNVRIAAQVDERPRIEEALRGVGLGDRLHDRAKLLSGGQQQRVAVVRALVNAPSVVLADEPISGLDETNGDAVLQLLAGAAREGAAVVVASHDARVRAIAHRTIQLSNGTLS